MYCDNNFLYINHLLFSDFGIFSSQFKASILTILMKILLKIIVKRVEELLQDIKLIIFLFQCNNKI